ncbi:hypothetical protein VMCG_08787 [Cytospora schulzeri]|uniref:Uncharacterized protein n=1 Tax=Cytospora schulzeri TaxID=448051 RepID=A0A423VS25_9PEZI|nr:hypothetical protein VMCG_08787 [Valsa malicola]
MDALLRHWPRQSSGHMLPSSPTSSLSQDDPRRLDRAWLQMQYSEKERKHQQLKSCIQRLRAARVPGSDPGSVDGAFEEYARVKSEARDIVRALVTSKPPGGQGRFQSRRGARGRHGSVQETVERLEMLRIANGINDNDDDVDGLMAAFGDMGIADATGAGRPPHSKTKGDRVHSSWLTTIRDWKTAIQKLLDSHRASLTEMYRVYERNATPQMVERMFNDPSFRAETLQRLRTTKVLLVSNEYAKAAAYWPMYERRFRNYDVLKEAVSEVDRFLRLGEAGVEDGDRLVKDYVIAERGDAILEFANIDSYNSPVMRFRVSSHMLAETSPIFKAIFQGQFSHPKVLDRDLRELDGQVPREPPPFVTCPDGTEVKLYSMPQLELNKEGSLTVLLYAAHMQNDNVPREVSFAQFTAIAEVCLRYQCTSPLEIVVEHRWLPAWVHMATEDQPDGLLLISYAFGLRRIFTRMSKNAVLNIVDEEELRGKNWPDKIKEKVWAVRSAKMAQVHAACSEAIQEYFRPPTGQRSDGQGTSPRNGSPLPPSSFSRVSAFLPTLQSDKPLPPPSYGSLFSLTSTPRCPKGSHWCDATNLGWLLLAFNELQLLWTVIAPTALPRVQETSPPHPSAPRSLAQLLDALRSIPSPPQAVHPGGSGVCDPAPVFRAAVNDVYNSISGLTLFDVDGKRHGWALSKRSANGPQDVRKIPLGSFGMISLKDDKASPIHCMDNGHEANLESLGNYSEDSDHGSGDDDGIWVYHPPVAFAPDGAVCLRIMSSVDNLDDLHALAVTNRTFYTVFKQNELTLMRRLVKANRRMTLNLLLAGSGEPLPSETGRRDDDKVLLQDNESAGHDVVDVYCYSMEDGDVQQQIQQQHPDGNAVSNGGVGPDGWVLEEPGDDHCMTEEEARQILWPDQPPDLPRHHDDMAGYATTGGGRARRTLSTPVPREDSGEKFLAGEITIMQVAEEKALVVLGDKNLREELDCRRGITSE